MKKYLSRTIKLLSLASMIALSFLFCQGYLFNSFNDTNVRWDSFFLEDKNTIDVAIVGASETYNDFSPSVAYGECKFTSVCLGNPGGSCYLIEDQIKELLAYQNPKLIFIEINCFLYEEDSELISDAKIRAISDNIPLTHRKIELINKVECEDPLISYYFPFIKYHSTNDICSVVSSLKTKLQMQSRGYSYLKGIYNNANSNTYKPKPEEIINVSNDNTISELNPIAEDCLYKLLDYCNSLNTKCVFVRFPHITGAGKSYEMHKKCNRAQDIIKKSGFEFINFEREYLDNGIDCNNDYYNSEHLNIYGQQKFTKYFANLIVDKYKINETQLSDEQKSEWAKSVEYTYLYYEYVDIRKSNNSGTDEWLYETSEVIDELEKLKASKE